MPSQIGLTVNSLADSGTGTLRAAIQTADMDNHSSDKFTIGFAPDLFTPGVTSKIELQSPLPDLNNSIAIQGPGAAGLTVERASGVPFASAIVTVDQTASLSGLTIANGNATGIVNDGGTLTICGCTISGNSGNNGGGILNDDGGTLTISGCTISGNSANSGGGILNESTLTISTSTLSGNRAGANVGGGIENLGTLTLTNSTVAGNFAIVGGGIFNLGSVTIQQNSTLFGNTALRFGGGILNDGTLAVRDSTLSGNSATGFDLGGFHVVGQGGGIYNFAVVTIQDSTLSGNTAEIGGGIDNDTSSTLYVRGSTFSGNTASDSGGGLYNLGTATLQESSFSGNAAGSDGGGIFNGAAATLTLDDSLVWANLASLLGADLYNLGKAIVNDSTVGAIGP